MNLYENILKRLLTELRDAPILGEMPAGSVYYAMLYPKGNVVYLAAGSDGMPVSRAADSLNPLHVFRAVNGKPLVQVQKDPERMKIVQKMLDAGLLTIEEKELSSWDVKPNQSRNFRGKNPELFQDPDNIPKTAGYIKSTLGYSSPVNAIKIDKDKKQIDLDAFHADWRTRRPGKNRDGKSYVIPSGDVAFGEKTLPLQKMFKHILGRDSGVDETFKIVGSEKFRGQTVADVISAPREYDAALTGQAGPITMYHGTSVKRWKEIQKKGLVPGKYDEAYVDLIPGYSEHNVYLTVSPAEAENYATRQAIKDKSKAMVLKVTVPDYTRFKPDEDQMGRIKLSRPYSLEVKRLTMRNMPVDLEEVNPKNFFYALRIDHYVPSEELEALKKEVESKISNELVSKSLKGGTIAYKGRIPPKFIKPFMEYKRQAFKTPERKGGPSGEEYQTIRKDVQQKAKRFDEARLRRMLRNILRENFENFKSRTKDIDYESGLDASRKDKARQLKRIFADEADHNFMKGLTKVHWVYGPNALRGFLQGASSRDEISTNAYLPGQKVKGGSTSYLDNHQMLGVEVQGRVTLAASDMDLLYTGAHWNADPKVKKSSGVIRRAMEFEGSSPYFVKHYILDAPSFAEAHKIAPGKVNEFVVDNWKPVAIRVGRPETYMNYDDPDRNLLDLDLVSDLAEKFNLPILGPSGEDLSEYFES